MDCLAALACWCHDLENLSDVCPTSLHHDVRCCACKATVPFASHFLQLVPLSIRVQYQKLTRNSSIWSHVEQKGMPRSCPARKTWEFQTIFTGRGGGSQCLVTTIVSTSRCNDRRRTAVGDHILKQRIVLTPVERREAKGQPTKRTRWVLQYHPTVSIATIPRLHRILSSKRVFFSSLAIRPPSHTNSRRHRRSGASQGGSMQVYGYRQSFDFRTFSNHDGRWGVPL